MVTVADMAATAAMVQWIKTLELEKAAGLVKRIQPHKLLCYFCSIASIVGDHSVTPTEKLKQNSFLT